MNSAILKLIVIFAISLVSGCTFTHNIDIKPNLVSLPQTKKSEVSAGIYYSPQFSDQKVTRINGENILIAPIGTASVQFFDNIFPRVFAKTSRVSSLTPSEMESENVDVVIAPTLEQLDYKLQMFQADSDRHKTSYRITLYNRRGVPVASWIVSGKNALKGIQGYGGMIENGMTDAAIMFLQDFEREAGPALVAVARNLRDPSFEDDAKNISLSAKPSDLPGSDPKQADALRNAGVIALQVTVHSDNERQLIVRASDMRLRLSGNQILEPSSISLILGDLESTSHAIEAALFFGPLAVLPTMIGQANSSEARRETELKAASQYLFQEKVLEKGKDETGIVFFTLPIGVNEEAIETLSAWVVDMAHTEGIQLKVALPINRH